jgi:hypothetical protein
VIPQSNGKTTARIASSTLRVLELVEAEPGLGTNDYARKAQTPSGSTMMILRRAEKLGTVRSELQGAARHWFPGKAAA